MDQFRLALDTRKHQARVTADVDAARQAGITGTPGFTVNGYFVSGAQPYGALRKAILLASQAP